VVCSLWSWYEGLAWFFAWSQTADVLCTKVQKRREKVRGGERVDSCEKELYIRRANYIWLLWKWTVFTCDQRCIHSADSVEKHFLNGSKRNEMGLIKHTWICPLETLVCNCWTNDYTLDQLDAGKNVQYGIECVIVCHLDYSKLFRPVHQPVHLR
jgi:hypothetical protein